MATRPEDLPQSIVLGQFLGIKNTVSEERLQLGELAAAVNVDIDDSGQVRRRRGYVRKDTADYHSAITIAGQTLVVKDGTLGYLGGDYSFEPLVAVGREPLAYTHVGSTVYFSSRITNGKIVEGVAAPWGVTDGSGLWVSPVVTPTAHLGEVGGKMLEAPPHATALAHYKGRIYLAAGRVLWATELYLYDHIDKARNFVVLDDEITMVHAVGDGIYVGTTTQLLFLSGILVEGLRRSVVSETGVVPGSVVEVPLSRVHPQARQGPVPEGDGPVFLTEAGVMLGLDGGQTFNLTQGRVVFPGATSAAALYREDQGATSYTAVADSAGGPSANTRIGDYVDAEIIRASQRGG